MKIRKKTSGRSDSTDLNLLVHTQDYEEDFSTDKIVEALKEEASLEGKDAQEIADSVEKQLKKLEMEVIPVNLIRDFVNVELAKKGCDKKLKRQRVIGIPNYDLQEIIFSKNLENSNIAANNPEAVNLAIAEHILKQYALENVFSQDVAQAHIGGVFHIHDLGYIDRVYCGGNSLEYIKLYGLDDLVNLQTASKPANHMSTLVGHMNTFMSSLACYYAGAIGFGFLNVFLAPFVYEDRMSYNEVLQNMQYLWYSASQNSFSRGGQALFTDMNFTLEIPSYFKDVKAVGKSGKYIDKTYGELEAEAQLVLEAVIEIISKGDKYGVPFAFPKADININANSFIVPKQKELMMKICEAASINGSPYFVFDDRNAGGEATVSQCCRLRSKITDPDVLKHPEKLRFCGVQNVTINLPQCAYRGRGKVEKVFEEVEWAMDLAMKAHLQKKKFLETLMKPNNPLFQLGKVFKDGSPYVNLEKSTYIIGMVGLNECVQFVTGKQLHEDEETFKLGLRIISHMFIKAQKLEKENGVKVTLEESPAESATYRLAKCDLREYPESKFLIKGDIDSGNEIYYTNSVHLSADAPVNILERITKQAKFHPLIESGAITHIFLGEQKPEASGIYNLIEKIWENTQTSQVTISPEFTICNDCHKVSRGWQR